MFRNAVGVLSLLVLASFPVSAAVFNVDSTVDAVDANTGDGLCAAAGNICTLRAAIMQANASAGDDTINVPAGTYTLTIPGTAEYFSATGDLNIRSNMTIDGAGIGATIIEAGTTTAMAVDRVFDIRNGPPTVRLTDMTIRHGYAGGASAGGIYAFANLTMQNVEVTDNSGAGNSGGGIYVEDGATLNLSGSIISDNFAGQAGGMWIGGATASATITDTTFSGNWALGAGAMWVRDGGTAQITNSTFSGNFALGSGVIAMGASDSDTASMTFTNSTLSGNHDTVLFLTRSSTSLTLLNVTIANNSHGLSIAGTTSLRNTILAGTTISSNCAFGTPTSAGNNLSDDTSCAAGFNAAGDQNNVDPQLATLALNAPGTTQTHALPFASPAVNAGAGCPATDQRGVARPSGIACDIGAYELVIVPGPGALRFQSATYSVVEGTPSVTVTVERIFDSAGSVTVDFDTDDGSAVAPADYGTQSGTLTFGDGVITQTIIIPIVNDGTPEGDQTFTVRIFNPTGGATIDTPSTTTVTISDPAAAAVPIPTMSEWGLILAMLALVAVGLKRM